MPPLRHPCPPLVRVALGLALLVAHVAAAPADSDNWAVIVSSSRYWLNYRHTANALGVYQAVRRCVLWMAMLCGAGLQTICPVRWAFQSTSL